MPPSPEEVVVTATLIDRIWDIGKWVLGAFGICLVWSWTASKEHSRFQTLETKSSDMEQKIAELETAQEDLSTELRTNYINRAEHDLMQQRCQEHVAREHEAKLHKAILEMKADNADLREEMSVMNANICRLMGRFNVEPVEPKEKRRRRSDMPPGSMTP